MPAALLALAAAAVSAAAPVSVEVFVQSWCPWSAQWQHDFLNVIAPQVGSIVKLTRHFDGAPEKDGGVRCLHGATECYANALQDCAERAVGAGEWGRWLNFTVCANGPCHGPKLNLHFCDHLYDMGTARNAELEAQCAAGLGLDWGALQKCAAGPEGRALIRADAEYDRGNETYILQGLPVVKIAGKRFSKIGDSVPSQMSDTAAYQKRLVAAICAAYTGQPRPAACP
eukprot:TRINITY_DN20732_c0_g1_i1.p1 TRINITY_DN20732_c0_g1~~TRINITY_DN20732_c0_g1_i1.p1  ORF type:complete len:228 (+),score=87.30 TRINITY_DN20732_c0_g1_i1:70-753(+)